MCNSTVHTAHGAPGDRAIRNGSWAIQLDNRLFNNDKYL